MASLRINEYDVRCDNCGSAPSSPKDRRWCGCERFGLGQETLERIIASHNALVDAVLAKFPDLGGSDES